MKTGAENRKKTIAVGVLGAGAVCGILYNLFALFGPSTPPPTVAPTSSAPAPVLRKPGATAVSSGTGSRGGGAVAGVGAQKLATSSASLDPTLNAEAMLRTESLVYTGSGRNVFSATYTPAVAAMTLPRNVPSARPGLIRPMMPQGPVGPPPPAPIPLKFFGTAQRARGVKQVFLLSGDDVYLASAGDIVAKRYKIDQVMPFGVQVTDLVSNVTQTLPLQQQ